MPHRLDARTPAFEAAFEVMMSMTAIVMKVLPLGVFGLITTAAVSADITTVKEIGRAHV